MDHQARWMKAALALAEEAARMGEIPVGAGIVDSGAGSSDAAVTGASPAIPPDMPS
jgi:tRNA(Arg) A34 adenosine deaminase TadA